LRAMQKRVERRGESCKKRPEGPYNKHETSKKNLQGPHWGPTNWEGGQKGSLRSTTLPKNNQNSMGKKRVLNPVPCERGELILGKV